MSEVMQYKLGMTNGFFVRDEGVASGDAVDASRSGLLSCAIPCR